jgi:predicted metal-binding membrane protein
MASANNVLGGMVLIAAGVYQWTPLKDVCLAQCQTPLQFLMRHGGFRGDVPGCLLLGLRQEPIASAAAGFLWRFCLWAG